VGRSDRSGRGGPARRRCDRHGRRPLPRDQRDRCPGLAGEQRRAARRTPQRAALPGGRDPRHGRDGAAVLRGRADEPRHGRPRLRAGWGGRRGRHRAPRCLGTAGAGPVVTGPPVDRGPPGDPARRQWRGRERPDGPAADVGHRAPTDDRLGGGCRLAGPPGPGPSRRGTRDGVVAPV
ncbi:MAG: hypothetical protein AVDCRST_MAG33-3288, partial [uncultured Thermomicrobiales bacterium]